MGQDAATNLPEQRERVGWDALAPADVEHDLHDSNSLSKSADRLPLSEATPQKIVMLDVRFSFLQYLQCRVVLYGL